MSFSIHPDKKTFDENGWAPGGISRPGLGIGVQAYRANGGHSVYQVQMPYDIEGVKRANYRHELTVPCRCYLVVGFYDFNPKALPGLSSTNQYQTTGMAIWNLKPQKGPIYLDFEYDRFIQYGSVPNSDDLYQYPNTMGKWEVKVTDTTPFETLIFPPGSIRCPQVTDPSVGDLARIRLFEAYDFSTRHRMIYTLIYASDYRSPAAILKDDFELSNWYTQQLPVSTFTPASSTTWPPTLNLNSVLRIKYNGRVPLDRFLPANEMLVKSLPTDSVSRCHISLPHLLSDVITEAQYGFAMPHNEYLAKVPHYMVVAFDLPTKIYPRREPMNLAVFPIPECTTVKIMMRYEKHQWKMIVIADNTFVVPFVRNLVYCPFRTDLEVEPFLQLKNRSSGPFDYEIRHRILKEYGMQKTEDISVALIPEGEYLMPDKIMASSPDIPRRTSANPGMSEWYASQVALYQEDIRRQERAKAAVQAEIKHREQMERQAQSEHEEKILMALEVFAAEYNLTHPEIKAVLSKLVNVFTKDVFDKLVEIFSNPRLEDRWYAGKYEVGKHRHVVFKIFLILREARRPVSIPVKGSRGDTEAIKPISPEEKGSLSSLIDALKRKDFSFLRYFGIPVTPRQTSRMKRKAYMTRRSVMASLDTQAS